MKLASFQVQIDEVVVGLLRDGLSSREIANIIHAAADRIFTAGEDLPIPTGILARRLQRSRWYIWRMRKAGYRFTHGRRTTLASALQWLKENPDFKTS